MVINWTSTAVDDLNNFKKISQLRNTTDYIISLVESTNLLLNNPNLGKIYFHTSEFIIRQFIYQEHKILYYINQNTIHIISIIHHKENIKNKINFIKKYFNLTK